MMKQWMISPDIKRGRHILFVSLFLLVLGSWDVPGWAHPHVFIDCFLTVIFDEQGLAGFRQRWEFDEMFTAFLLEEFDADGNSRFDAAEIQAVKQGAFDNLREFEYFTHLLIRGTAFIVQDVTSFSIELNGLGNAVYTFFVPCPVEVSEVPQEICISIFDDTYYTDIVLQEKAVEWQQSKPFDVQYKVHDIPELSYYYDQIVPQGLFIKMTPALLSSPPASSPAEQIIPPGVEMTVTDSPWLQPLFTTLLAWQKSLKQHVTQFGQEIQQHPWGRSFWLFLLCSFGYGILHALGPGHGKSIVVSYFLSHPGKYLHGALMGHTLTFVHVFSAVILLAFVRLVLGMIGGMSFERASKHLSTVSYSLLIVLGVLLLGKSVYDLKQRHCTRRENTPVETFKLKPLMLTAFITGLVPCPGAALILIFAITQRIVWAGLAAIFCMAAGMGITTTTFALLAIASRKTLFRLTADRQKLLQWSQLALSFSGALMILCIGTLLLLGPS